MPCVNTVLFRSQLRKEKYYQWAKFLGIFTVRPLKAPFLNFLITFALNDFEIVPKAFFTSLLQPMLPCCRPTVCVEVCLHGIFFQWILLQFKAPFLQLSRRKSLPINLIIIRAWLKKRRLRGGHMVIKPPSVDTCVLTFPSPPPPNTTTTHPKLEL